MFKEIFIWFICYLFFCLVYCDLLSGVQQIVNMVVLLFLSVYCLKMVVMFEEELWKMFDIYSEGLNQVEVEFVCE